MITVLTDTILTLYNFILRYAQDVTEIIPSGGVLADLRDSAKITQIHT